MNRKIIALTAATAALALPVASFAQGASSSTTTKAAATVRHDHGDVAAALAKELGLDTATVKAALAPELMVRDPNEFMVLPAAKVMFAVGAAVPMPTYPFELIIIAVTVLVAYVAALDVAM